MKKPGTAPGFFLSESVHDLASERQTRHVQRGLADAQQIVDRLSAHQMQEVHVAFVLVEDVADDVLA